MNHVVLLGDSIFDNAAYVGGGPDVVRQLHAALPASWRATLNARDGAVTADIEAQLATLPADASHLVLSIGGNDALLEAGVMDENARSVGIALDKLAAVRERFLHAYRAMLSQVMDRNLPTAVCTIYEARFPDADLRRRAAAALTLLNDCITRETFARDLTLIDLRLICDSDADFANPIEPSVEGGAKIARAIAQFAAGTGTRATVIPH
jgi:GDSL-like Lipase/Acylhydrolase family